TNGTYWVVCRDDTVGERYDYTLSLTKFPATNAVPIYPGQVLRGSLINYSQLDVYRFEGTADELVNLVIVRASGGGFYPYVELRAPDGTYLAGADNTSGVEYLGFIDSFRLPTNGTYWVVCRDDTVGERYDYTLSLTTRPDPNARILIPGRRLTNGLVIGDSQAFNFAGIAGDKVHIQAKIPNGGGSYL